MKEVRDDLKGLADLKKLGTAKIAGLVCNKNSPMKLRIEIDIEQHQAADVLAALDLEGTDKLKESLQAVLNGMK